MSVPSERTLDTGPQGVASAGAAVAEHPENEIPSGGPPQKTADPLIGKKLSHFTIKSLIGRGGMGAVYLAEQSVPVQREVAVKVLRSDIGDESGTKRFIAERQALAMMNHTDIAQVYDGGLTDDGHHYFAMELVEGLPIDEFCDQERIGVQDRLVLAFRICDAIEHAHERGVLHRDIKPGNVIVSKMGNQTRLKVIDFGIAKAFGTRTLAHDAVETQVGQIIGTPAYMSPEQAELRNDAVDQRSDVYAIGVLIYKLLTGTTPLQAAELKDKSLTEVLQAIASVDAERPSTRIRSLDSTSRAELANKLSTEATLHRDTLRRELDWLVLKAIHIDRNSRYRSAAELGEDIQRYLDHKPISAVSASHLYHVRKFYRRNRSTWLAIMVMAIAALGSTFTYSQFQHRQELARAAVGREVDSLVAQTEELRNGLPISYADSLDAWDRIERHVQTAETLAKQADMSAASHAKVDALGEQTKRDSETLAALRHLRLVTNRLSIFHGGTLTIEETETPISDSEISRLIAEASEYPTLFQPILLESLTLQMASYPRGAGFDVARDQNGLFVKTVYENGAAAKTGKIYPSQRLLDIPSAGKTAASLRKMSPNKAAKLLNGPPLSKRTVTMALPKGKPPRIVTITCGGQESFEIVETLNQIDNDPWRTSLRNAVIEYDEKQLRALAASPELRNQPLHSFILLAVGLRQVGLEDGKLGILRVAQQLFPQQALSHLALAEALALESNPRRLNEAARYLTATIAVDGKNVTAQFLLARVLQELGKTAEAKRQYKHIIAKHPKAVAPRAYYVSMLQIAGRDREAATVYQNLVEEHGEKEQLVSTIKKVQVQQLRRKQIPAYQKKVNRIASEALRKHRQAGVKLPQVQQLKRDLGGLSDALGR